MTFLPPCRLKRVVEMSSLFSAGVLKKSIMNEFIAPLPVENTLSEELCDKSCPFFRQLDAQKRDGFAITSQAYHLFLEYNNLELLLPNLVAQLDTVGFSNLEEIGTQARAALEPASLPYDLQVDITAAYFQLQDRAGDEIDLVVWEDCRAAPLPAVHSFETKTCAHNATLVKDDLQLLEACLNCYRSFFSNQAIKSRSLNGKQDAGMALFIGTQHIAV